MYGHIKRKQLGTGPKAKHHQGPKNYLKILDGKNEA